MRNFLLTAMMALPLAACGYSYGSTYGYDRYAYDPYSYGYSPIYSVGILGSAYGSSFSQAAVNACANYAAQFGAPRVTSVRQDSSSRMKVYGYVNRGFGTDNWDCTFRADGRITDFDL